MVINSDSDDSSTAKRSDFNKPRYRPQFLDHFERKNSDMRSDAADKSTTSEYSPAAAHVAALAAAAVNTQVAVQQAQINNHNNLNRPQPPQHPPLTNTNSNDSNWESNMEMHFQQISAINQYGLQQHQQHIQQQLQQQQQQVAAAAAYFGYNMSDQHILALNQQQQQQQTHLRQPPPPAYPQQQQQQQTPQAPHHHHHPHHHLHSQSHAYVDGEFEFLKFLTFDDLNQRLNNIDSEMEKEIEELNKKYNAKRQPIVDAMNAKRKRQQNINNNLIKI